MKARLFFIVFLSSMLLRVCLMGVSALQSMYLSGWGFSFSYCVFTWYMLDYCEKKGDVGYLRTTLAVILGYIILVIPIHIMDYRGTYISLILHPVTIISIILSAVCHKSRHSAVVILSSIIILLVNSVIMQIWLEYCQDYLNLGNILY